MAHLLYLANAVELKSTICLYALLAKYDNHIAQGMAHVSLKDVQEQRMLKLTLPLDGIEHASIAVELRWRFGLDAT